MKSLQVVPVFLAVISAAIAFPQASDANSESSGNSSSAVDRILRQQAGELIAVLNNGTNNTTPAIVLEIAEDYVVSNVSDSLRREIADELRANEGEDFASLSEGLKERIRWHIVQVAIRSLPHELQSEIKALRGGPWAADRVPGADGQQTPIIREYRRGGFWRRLGRGLRTVGGRILTTIATNAILRG